MLAQQEKLLNKIYLDVKIFLARELSEIPLNTSFPIKTYNAYCFQKIIKPNQYICGFNLCREISFYFHEQSNHYPEDIVIPNFLDVSMKRKNAYFISLIHETAEGTFITQIPIGKLTGNHTKEIHKLAIKIELISLDRLIERGIDKKEFIKRKQARLKDIVKNNIIF